MQWAGKVVNEQMQLKSHERGDPTLNLNMSHIISIASKAFESYHDGQQLQKDMTPKHTPLLQ